MKEIYAYMDDGSCILLLRTGDKVDVDRWVEARLRGLRRVGAVRISCKEEPDEVNYDVAGIERLLAHCI
jgi:hypothetical protein